MTVEETKGWSKLDSVIESMVREEQRGLTKKQKALVNRLLDQHGQKLAERAYIEFNGLVPGGVDVEARVFGLLASLTIYHVVRNSVGKEVQVLRALSKTRASEILARPDHTNLAHQAFVLLLKGVVVDGARFFGIQ